MHPWINWSPHQPSIPNGSSAYGGTSHESLSPPCLDFGWLDQDCTSSYSHCEFTMPKNFCLATFLQSLVPTLFPTPMPNDLWTLLVGELVQYRCSIQSWSLLNLCFLCIDQFWVSVSIMIYCRLRDVLITNSGITVLNFKTLMWILGKGTLIYSW